MKPEGDRKVMGFFFSQTFFFFLPTGNEEVSVSSVLKGQSQLEENCASGVKKSGKRHHYRRAPYKTSGEGSRSSHL